MKLIDIAIILFIILIVGLAALYIYKAKKNGQKCIGCPAAATCKNNNKCEGCSGCNSQKISK